MIVVMQQHCSDEAIEHVMSYLKNHGLSGHLSQGVERTVIGVLGAVGPSGTRTTAGGINPAIGEALESLPCVNRWLSLPNLTSWPVGSFTPQTPLSRFPLHVYPMAQFALATLPW